MGGTLVYALGGGAGHLARALAFAARLLPPRSPVTVLHAAGAPRRGGVPPWVHLRAVGPDTSGEQLRAITSQELGARRDKDLVVDTFPGGLAHELDDRTLAAAARTTLVRRFVKPLSYAGYGALAARYDVNVVPYDRARSEWEPMDEPSTGDACFCGPLIRALEVGAGSPAPLAVIGDPARVGRAMTRHLPRGTVFARGPLERLPPARAYLGTGAGYHLAYELASLGVPFGLMPVERRYDDQYRRADLLGRAVSDASSLAALLEEAA